MNFNPMGVIEMTKMELKKYRDDMIITQYKQGLAPEELAYVYNISARRIGDILKGAGIAVKIDNKRAEELKSTRSPKAMAMK